MRVLQTALIVSVVVVGVSAQSGGKQFVGPAPGQSYSQAISVGGFVYVSGMMASDVSGDITAQTTQIFENLRGVLKQAGSSVDDIVVATITLEQAGDLTAMDQIYGAQFRGAPPARTVYIGNMVRPGALIEIWVTAVPSGAPRQAIMPAGWMKSTTHSWAMLSGDTLFLSGMVGANMADYTPVRGDVPTQVRKAMDNAVELLKTAGMTLNETVSARNVISQRVADFGTMNTTYAPYWTVKDWKASGPGVPGRPGRATVGLDNPPGFDFQTTFIAVRSSAAAPREVVVAPTVDGTPGEQGPWFPSGITVGNRMWVSGTTGGSVQPIKAHIQNNINSLVRFMKASGFDLTHVVAVEVWLTNVRHYEVMDQVFRETFPKNPPVRKVVGVDSLGGTSNSEIAFIAVR
jgi:2-iminobutanoate/2-iminopropanoate deaminase